MVCLKSEAIADHQAGHPALCRQILQAICKCSNSIDFFKSICIQIRPQRFGGEGVLIGGQNSNTKCSMTFVNIAVAISALAGGAKNGFAPRPELGGVFDIFRGFLGV